jgi:hypothetical protein
MHIYIYIYILLVICQNQLNIEFLGSFLKFSELPRQFSPDMSGLWPGHVRVSGFSLYKGLSTPSNPNFAKPLSSLSCRSQGISKAFFKLLQRIPLVSRGFDSPSLQNLQTLRGFSLLRYSSRFFLDFFDLLLIYVNVGSPYFGAPPGCRNLALNLV